MNIILFGIVEGKRYESCIINSFLKIKNKDNNNMFKSIKYNCIYLLLQPRLSNQYKFMTKVYKTVKLAIKKKYYQKIEHINNNNFVKMPKLVTRILFSRDNAITKLNFCRAYILGK